MLKSSNPMLSENSMENVIQLDSVPMSIQGTMNKMFILASLMALSFGVVWYQYILGYADKVNMLMLVGLILGFIIALITVFKKTLAPYLSPVYAFCEGAVLGGITVIAEQSFPGIALQAISATIGCVFAMFFAYKSGLIKVTGKFRSTLLIAGLGILVLYIASFILAFFNIQIPFLFTPTPLGIGISIVICVIAALYLLLDFDLIEKANQAMMPKYMEWYCAFSLMVTIVWLYIEILRLIQLLRSR